ncbi:interleukin 21 receptor, tandem duplicate 1 isoform X1 [Hypomesus transpacificus]|uniref:interleukin 21 receptor, tandem duplicate 1 isoform X1 n=2 Tax=Hypomesus transpacificus TaxID=137520 RepID=UPI001F07D5F8|nr:interleukin 21 receptor, tandem duplicate 1 isoform X1 [Hypomesus transpacificus]XP_046894919.1 interleukin 21 receptor, tandem duplicate 1 isoform X1 [Hypomesus transpacificus]XP_046894920.1 interleukin 21 receptor, tandem duplicate 1 isoform X1 [Hypomesus transpacificus]
MAIKLLALHLLWILSCLIQDAESICLINCCTNWNDSLNCSWSGIIFNEMSPSPLTLEVECRDYGGEINGSCEIISSQGWCLIRPKDFYLYASLGTRCSSKIKYSEKLNVMPACTNDSFWNLEDMVKPQQPFNVHATETKESYNITWETDDQLENLMYRVRIRTKDDPLKDPIHYTVRQDQKYITINYIQLEQQAECMVDVQAKVGPNSIHKGPWSEWSSTTELDKHTFTAHIVDTKRDDILWWSLLSLVFVLGVLGLIYCRKPSWFTMKYIPKPDAFFQPLYHTYDGDFKKWVRPIFSESDHLMMNPPVQEMPVKQLEVIMLTCGSIKERSSEDNQGNGRHGIASLLSLAPHSSSLLYFSGGSGHSTGHSAGHISIHTVTTSGGGEATFGGSTNGLGSKFKTSTDCNMNNEERLSVQKGRRSSICSLAVEWQPQAQHIEPEQISLDSFCSNEPSDDGYPRVDLDTIDSGFMESDCGPPMNSEFDNVEQMNSSLLSGAESSNYVKQWMICNTVEGNPDNPQKHSTSTP